jgi:hypothetical protein
MAHRTFKILAALARLPEQVRHPHLWAGLDEARPARIHPLKAEIAKSKEHTRRCEACYKIPRSILEQKLVSRFLRRNSCCVLTRSVSKGS